MTLIEREPHPVFPLLSEEQERAIRATRGEAALADYYKTRKLGIKLMTEQPLVHGFEPEIWRKTDRLLVEFRERYPVGPLIFMVLGGNRASKTEWRAKRLVQNMEREKDYIAWACHTTQASSRDAQQRKIYKYLPDQYKSESGRLRYGRVAKINYTPWGGFTTDGFAFPSREGGVSECSFKFYGMDPRSLEGSEINEGWMDEESPVEWMEALIGRAVTRNGMVFLTFTAKFGYTPLVKTILDGARIVEEEKADPEMLPVRDANGAVIDAEYVPRVMENDSILINTGDGGSNTIKARGLIVYFHTADNPFGNPEGMRVTLRGATRERVLWQFYGVPTRNFAAQFNFKDNVHVISMNRFAEILRKYPNGTRYHMVDPCSGRPWFMGWFFCPCPNKYIIYREWPSHGHQGAYVEGLNDPGPWAVPGDAADGAKGPAQKPMHFGLPRYVEEILKAERTAKQESRKAGNEEEESAAATGRPLTPRELAFRAASECGSTAADHGPPITDHHSQEPIFQRWMDCRYGNASMTTGDREDATTLIQLMAELGMDFIAMTAEKKILNTPDGSIDMINSALYYDKTAPIGAFSPELGRINEPELLVTENCPNVIFALKTWTGKDGMHGACKDPIDIIRGFFLSRLGYVGPEMMRVRGGGCY